MQKVPIEKAASGMILAKPVTRQNGVVLMGEGTELNEALIAKLKDLEIKKIAVKGRPLDTGVGPEKSFEQLSKEVNERFSTVETDALCKKIKALIIQDLKQRQDEKEL